MKNGGTEKFGSAMYHDYISDSILRFPAFTPAGNAGSFLPKISSLAGCAARKGDCIRLWIAKKNKIAFSSEGDREWSGGTR